MNFSAQTQVNQLQDLIDSKVEKRRRGVYGPPSGKKLVTESARAVWKSIQMVQCIYY